MGAHRLRFRNTAFRCYISAAKINFHIPINDLPRRSRALPRRNPAADEDPCHDGFVSRSLGQRPHRTRKLAVDVGRGHSRGNPARNCACSSRAITGRATPARICASRKSCAKCGASSAPKTSTLSVMTQNFDLTRGYFGGTRQVRLPDVFPPFLHREVPQYHGVVACEGSMFKSKFANALATMMIGSLGLASAQNRLSIGYGAEAGYMDPIVEKMCRRYCKDSARDYAKRRVSRVAKPARHLRRNWARTRLGHLSRAAPNTVKKCCAMRDGMATRQCLSLARSIHFGGR